MPNLIRMRIVNRTVPVVALLFDQVLGTVLLPYPSNLVVSVLPGENAGAQVIAPHSSTCAGVGVARTGSVTIRLSDNEDVLLGMQFDVSTPNISFTQVETVGLAQACESGTSNRRR